MKAIVIGALALAAIPLAGCNSSDTAITSAICTDAATLTGSTLALNTNEKTALKAVNTTCAATAGGTVFSNSTVALALINDAILLQQSGLLSEVHITAQAPDAQLKLRHIKAEWLAKIIH